jgi:cathepsin L
MNLVRQMQSYTFEDFMTEHDKTYVKGTKEYKKRAAVFYRRKAETIRLAGLSKLTWTPAVNKFMDQTKPEIKARLGYKPTKGKAVAMARKPLEQIPSSWTSEINMNWVPNMTYSADFQKDQGACGSCWAVATSSAVEAHADVHFGASVPLSDQQLVSCTKNERHCGGSGGCGGATAELALEYAAGAGGMVMEQNYQYTSMFGDSGICDMEKTRSPTVLIGGYTSVPQNDLAATMYAVSKGPVIVAVDASPWSFYGAGIFGSCRKDATLNHAVVLVGYGMEKENGYWLIRNSWGSDWGMDGYQAQPKLASHQGIILRYGLPS